MTGITIGQYYPENSIIHKLDPRVKLFGTLVFIILVFLIDNILGYVVFAGFMGAIIKVSKVPFIQFVFNSGSYSFGYRNINNYQRRHYKKSFHGYKIGILSYMYINYDVDNYTKRPGRWLGKVFWIFESNKSAGT